MLGVIFRMAVTETPQVKKNNLSKHKTPTAVKVCEVRV